MMKLNYRGHIKAGQHIIALKHSVSETKNELPHSAVRQSF